MIAGGSDTTIVTVIRAFSLILNNLPILKKAQEELDARIGKQRHVEEADIAGLTYLQPVVKEILHLQPTVLLSPPCLFSEDCTVGGYHVLKGTQLIMNVSKVHTDSRTWPDPLEFRLERFLSSHKDVDVRIYPGISFGLRMVHFLLAKFLHAFEISTADDSVVDMSTSFELMTIKAISLEFMVRSRLLDKLYTNEDI
ncbi:hypothetical protein EUGRSUZ_F01496 [Eucalyptus grandis]|uniref:Uncharacterized protein n=2 Tax=Eucalyptus grandis TaxID=71139 RepID=A0ACC3KGS4_EUCGR|nr:hypothetical protein EUGRSUZ_F01496 [Eucalyptus grandis]